MRLKPLKKFKQILVLCCIVMGSHFSCGLYSFTGASIPAEMSTVSVDFFENTAPIVVTYLSQEFTEALKTRIRNQSRLSMVRSEADAAFEGRITGYSITPTAVQGNDRAGLNRLTITVAVSYKNRVDPKLNFEQSFSRFEDFSTTAGPIQSQEPQLIKNINDMLTDDIFNRAFANW